MKALRNKVNKVWLRTIGTRGGTALVTSEFPELLDDGYSQSMLESTGSDISNVEIVSVRLVECEDIPDTKYWFASRLAGNIGVAMKWMNLLIKNKVDPAYIKLISINNISFRIIYHHTKKIIK
jgi:hypothetical protein